MPRISIIIPVFNRANLLSDTLESVLHQTYSDFEVIVVDNASADGTPGLMARYCQRDPRVVYIRKAVNDGMIAAWHTGYQRASGEFVSVLSSDDTIEPELLERQLAYLELHLSAALVYPRFYNIDFDGRRLNKTWLMPDGFVLDQLLVDRFVHFGATLFRKSALDHIGGFDPSVQTDAGLDILLRCALAGYQFGCIQEPLGSCRLHLQNQYRNIAKEEAALDIILRKAFAHPSMPPATAAQKDRAYTSMRMWLVLGYYNALNFCEGKRNLRQALALNPSWRTDPAELLAWVRALALSVRVFEPERFVTDVLSHWPDEIELDVRQRNELTGQVCFGQALRHYQASEIADAKRMVERAVQLWPALLTGGKLVEDLLFSHALSIPDGSPRWFVNKVLDNLPESAAALQHDRARLLSHISVLSAFGYYHACEYKFVPGEVMSAVSSHPTILGNWGLLSICVRSLIAA